MPNGSDVRMTYQGQNHYAQVRHEKVVYEGNPFSPSQLASKIADDTARNAWHDLWIKFPGDTKWQLASDLRCRRRREE